MNQYHVLQGNLSHTSILTYAWRGIEHNFKNSWLGPDALNSKTSKVRILANAFHCTVQCPLMALASLVNAVATPILVLVDLAFRLIKQNRFAFVPSKEFGCAQFFSSGLWPHYFAQIKDITVRTLETLSVLKAAVENKESGNNLNKEERSAVAFFSEILNHQPPAEKAERYRYYQQFTSQFRMLSTKALSESNLTPLMQEAVILLKEIIYARYSLMDLSQELSLFAEELDPSLVQNEALPFWDRMQNHYSALESNPRVNFDGLRFTFFDAHYLGNLPYLLTDVDCGEGHTAQLIRMPSVTRDTSKSHLGVVRESKVIEDFRLYNEALKDKGEKHLYINLMDRTRSGEQKKSNAIESIDREEHTAIHVVSLDKDSDFYYQKGIYGNSNTNAARFIDDFHNHLFDTPRCFYWSKEIDQNDLQDAAKIAMQTIHASCFKSKETLSISERKDFIELVYCHLIDHLLHKIKPARVNMSCLHCKDRGAAQEALYTVYNHAKTTGDAPLELDQQVHLKKLTFLPSILIENVMIQKWRFDRFVSAGKRIIPDNS